MSQRLTVQLIIGYFFVGFFSVGVVTLKKWVETISLVGRVWRFEISAFCGLLIFSMINCYWRETIFRSIKNFVTFNAEFFQTGSFTCSRRISLIFAKFYPRKKSTLFLVFMGLRYFTTLCFTVLRASICQNWNAIRLKQYKIDAPFLARVEFFVDSASSSLCAVENGWHPPSPGKVPRKFQREKLLR